MSPELKQKCDQALAALRGLWRQGGLTSAVYYKGVVCIAYEFIVASWFQEGITILLLCPADYYRDTMPGQLVEDPEYGYVARRVAELLVKHGYAEAAAPMGFTQKQALA